MKAFDRVWVRKDLMVVHHHAFPAIWTRLRDFTAPCDITRRILTIWFLLSYSDWRHDVPRLDHPRMARLWVVWAIT